MKYSLCIQLKSWKRNHFFVTFLKLSKNEMKLRMDVELSSLSPVQSEAEKLQRLKERVETQEAKLKKIRAMRGQVDYSKLINGNLCKPERTKHDAEMMSVDYRHCSLLPHINSVSVNGEKVLLLQYEASLCRNVAENT